MVPPQQYGRGGRAGSANDAPPTFSLRIEQPATQADKRALTQRGKVEERRQDETVSINFPTMDETQTGVGSDVADQQPSA